MLQTRPHSLSQSLPQQSQTYLKSHRWLNLVFGLLFLTVCTGCTSSGWNGWASSPALEFRISQVEAANRLGVYTVAGQTTLPNKTQITVSAVRYPQNFPASKSADAQPLGYTILDRQFAQVNQGTWKTSLNLRQSAENQVQAGQPQKGLESQTQAMPNSNVIFLATLDPTQQPSRLQDQLDRLDPTQQLALSRFTPDGELYLQASQALTVPLPSVPVVASPAPSLTEVVPDDSPGADWTQTSLPLSPDNFLR